jgi:ribosomal protein S6--L-glutamate ligase
MKIVIFSRGPGLYSTQSLFHAGLRRGHQMEVIDHMMCNMVVENEKPGLFCNGLPLEPFDAAIPRIGASVTLHGASVIRQMEAMGIFTATRSSALLNSRDKLRSLQLLSMAGIPVPKSVYVNRTEDLPLLLQQVGGMPVVIKLLESTHGIGVMLIEKEQTAMSVIETLTRAKQRVIIQEFIAEAKGADIRAFVVGGQVVATMERQAAAGEFRSNMHRGATARSVRLSEEEANIVLKSARIMGLEIAGVDFLRTSRGPMVMEVNASPGLEGIETITGEDVAGRIIDSVARKARKFASIRQLKHSKK